MSRGREPGIDALKLAAFAVVLLHALPDIMMHGQLGAGLVSLTTRFAVPVFFIASGYLLVRRAMAPAQAIGRMLSRIAPIFLFWLSAYLLLMAEGTARSPIRGRCSPS